MLACLNLTKKVIFSVPCYIGLELPNVPGDTYYTTFYGDCEYFLAAPAETGTTGTRSMHKRLLLCNLGMKISSS